MCCGQPIHSYSEKVREFRFFFVFCCCFFVIASPPVGTKTYKFPRFTVFILNNRTNMPERTVWTKINTVDDEQTQRSAASAHDLQCLSLIHMFLYSIHNRKRTLKER